MNDDETRILRLKAARSHLASTLVTVALERMLASLQREEPQAGEAGKGVEEATLSGLETDINGGDHD